MGSSRKLILVSEDAYTRELGDTHTVGGPNLISLYESIVDKRLEGFLY